MCVGGDFLTAGSVTANGVACWDGTGWSAVGGGVAHEFSGSASVTALATDGETLFVGGDFTLAGEARAHSVAGRSGGQWHALGNGLNAAVTAMAVSGTNVYVGGDFTTAGGLAVNHIARWNGNAWSAMGSGLRDAFAPLPYVGAIAVSGDDVYVGGAFTHAGGVGVANIARWDGTTWHGLGSGLSGWVAALATQGPVVYAGGAFTAAGGVAAAGIALWDGSDWSALSDGLDDWVRAIAVGGSNVYAGGDFKFAGNVEARHVARWDGMAWSALGGGLSDVCRALAVSGTNLYVGGDFLLAGGVAAARVARWNGADWAALGSGLDGACRALACTGDVVYAAGEFLAAGDAPANRVAAWNGTEWSPLGSGLTVGWTAAPRANALALGPTNLFAGGDFLWAGDAPSRAFAAWSLEATGARLMALPRTISAAAVRGHNPPAQSLEIWSSDTNALTYVLESRAAWLAVDPQSGSTTGEHDTVGLVFDAASLDFGDYATAVTVTSAEAANSPMTVPVHLSVRGPRIACGTNSLAATIRQGEPLPEFRMEVWNAGVDVLDYTVEDDAVWLSPDPAGGSSTGEHDTVTLRLEPTAITSGTWLATVTLASPFAENSPRTVSVSLTVTPVIADTDGDGLPDYWEERYGGNPTGMAPHAHLDSDNADNLSEFISGTDPTNGQSYLGIRQAWVLSPPAGTGTVVRWSSVPGRYYRLQRSTNLLMDPFTHSVHTGIPAGLVENTVTDATAQGASPRFYRIRVEP